jgi:endoglucanase
LIDAGFLARVKSIVDLNLAEGLKVVLNVHHFEELYADPDGQRERFLAIWRQIARHFQHADERVFLELLNEPHGKLNAERWNTLLADATAEIRATHPTRWIVVGPDQFNGIKRLPGLVLPAADRHLLVTVHYYLPFAFTHQGASWVRPSPPVGQAWTGSVDERAEIERDFALAAEWAKQNHRPIYVGEFGAYSRADLDSRAKWTQAVRTTSEASGFAWAYWELAAGFGVLDPKTKQWRPQLLEALVER